METLEVVVSFDYFERASQAFFRPFDKLSGVPPVCPYKLESSESLAQVFEDKLGAVAVLQGGFMYDDGYDQAERVHYEMAFSPVDFLAGVISAKPPFSVVLTD